MHNAKFDSVKSVAKFAKIFAPLTGMKRVSVQIASQAFESSVDYETSRSVTVNIYVHDDGTGSKPIVHAADFTVNNWVKNSENLKAFRTAKKYVEEFDITNF